MPMSLLSHLSLEEQLHELEDRYADCLIDNADVNTLSQLWIYIQELRHQLTMPIYHCMTPRN